MRVKVNAPKVIQVAPETFKGCAKGYIRKLPRQNLNIGDRIRLKEHTGNHYTGREIFAEVTETTDTDFTFKKYSITHDKSRGQQNVRDERWKPYNQNKWNVYV